MIFPGRVWTGQGVGKNCDGVEKLFCGNWTFLREKDENLEEFMVAAGEYSDKVMHEFSPGGLGLGRGWGKRL